MKITLNINDQLFKKVAQATGIKDKNALVHLGLKTLIQRSVINRLIAAGGTDPDAQTTNRHRFTTI